MSCIILQECRLNQQETNLGVHVDGLSKGILTKGRYYYGITEVLLVKEVD